MNSIRPETINSPSFGMAVKIDKKALDLVQTFPKSAQVGFDKWIAKLDKKSEQKGLDVFVTKLEDLVCYRDSSIPNIEASLISKNLSLPAKKIGALGKLSDRGFFSGEHSLISEINKFARFSKRQEKLQNQTVNIDKYLNN